MENALVYLDHNATSPPSKEHLHLLVEKLLLAAGNPSSPHRRGRAASVALTEARQVIAKALGVEAKDLIFTGSASEANNCATTGVLRHASISRPLNEQHVIFSKIEHPSICEPLESLQKKEGLRITQLPVNENGFVSLEDLIKNITPETTLITLMAANNEIGSLQPVKEFADFLHHMRWGNALSSPGLTGGSTGICLHPSVTRETLRRLHFHVDAVQSFGKIRSEKWFSDGIDSCSLSAHKIGGIQGIGVLFLRQGRKFQPLILGGSQEKNRRAGTENLPGVISFSLVAQALLDENWWSQVVQMERRRKMLYSGLQKFPHVVLNSPDENVLPNTVNFSLCGDDINGEDLIVQLDLHGICASSGSACSSGANLPSKIILALNKPIKYAKNSVRFSLSVNTKDIEIVNTLTCLKHIFEKS